MEPHMWNTLRTTQRWELKNQSQHTKKKIIGWNEMDPRERQSWRTRRPKGYSYLPSSSILWVWFCFSGIFFFSESHRHGLGWVRCHEQVLEIYGTYHKFGVGIMIFLVNKGESHLAKFKIKVTIAFFFFLFEKRINCGVCQFRIEMFKNKRIQFRELSFKIS